jgi:TolA-binding protein
MKQPVLSLPVRLAALFAVMLLSSSCAPAPGLAPSVALREQLQDIKQQQQDQAAQLQQVTRQLALLQQALGIDTRDGQLADPFAEVDVAARPPAEERSAAPPAVDLQLGPEVNDYLAAFAGLASGQPDLAEAGFERFLVAYPDHRHSPNARYWLARAQAGQGKTELAVTNLKRIITDPAAQAKAPAALFQLAQLYRQQGLTQQAADVVEQLRTSYPDSLEVQQLNRSNGS